MKLSSLPSDVCLVLIKWRRGETVLCSALWSPWGALWPSRKWIIKQIHKSVIDLCTTDLSVSWLLWFNNLTVFTNDNVNLDRLISTLCVFGMENLIACFHFQVNFALEVWLEAPVFFHKILKCSQTIMPIPSKEWLGSD